MSLSEQDRGVICTCPWIAQVAEGDMHTFGCSQRIRAVEAIVQRAVNAALTEAADAIEATSDQRERDLRIPIGEVDAYAEAADIVRARRT